MSLTTSIRLARRELRGSFSSFRIFMACLALGVAAIAAIGSVRTAIENSLIDQGAVILGGDAEIDFTYRFANEDEREWIDNIAIKVSEIADFQSMAIVERSEGTERSLTQVKAVDSSYPLIGKVKLLPDILLGDALGNQGGLPGAVMDPALIDRLGLKIGDTFRLATQDFILSAALEYEPDKAGDGFTLGPRTIVMRTSLEKVKLLTPGTLFSSKYRMIFAKGFNIVNIETETKKRFQNSGLRWRDFRNGAPGVTKFVDRLGTFLVLLSLAGLAVGGVGISAAVRAYLVSKTSVIAILRTLGAERSIIFQTYFIQIGVFALLGTTIGLILGAILPITLAPFLETSLPVQAQFKLYPAPLLEAALYGLLTAFIFTLWPLSRTENVRPANLFREELISTPILPAARYLVWIAIGVITVISLSGLLSGAWKMTFWTTGSIALILGILTAASVGIRWLARTTAAQIKGFPALRWALAAIAGSQEGATSVVISLGLGLSVLSVVGQVDGNLRNAISTNLPEIAPSYFLVDIQPNQIEDYTKRLKENPAVKRLDTAPMLRGVITKINNTPAREVAGSHWVTSGDRGVTYAHKPPKMTQVTKGEWWPENYEGPPQISFAAEEAAEIGLKLGDTLTINILGRDITGTITSFRDVDFSTAEIGFILTMNPTALNGAPHTYISTIYAEESSEIQILQEISTEYPNVTAIRVKEAINRVKDILTSIVKAISYGAGATLLTGFLVLIGAAAVGTQARIYEAAILKTLGAKRYQILLSFSIRAAMLGLGAGIIALLVGIIGGWAVSTFMMETDYSIIWTSAFAVIAGGVIATLGAGLIFIWRQLSARPARVLRDRE